ncbi:hypothetical protein, partial [Eubacterium callanderi]|uniref:hypothetical protein n=1 Tax=Eubacterium callanderi TaxID=53442 RepID=UPI001AA0E678
TYISAMIKGYQILEIIWMDFGLVIATGYLASFIFYLTQVLTPEISKEKKSFKAIENRMNVLAQDIDIFLLELGQCIEITKDDRIIIKKETENYILYQEGEDVGFGGEFSLDANVSLEIKEINKSFDKITNNILFGYNKMSIITLISELQQNEFLERIEKACNCVKVDNNILFGGIYEDYKQLQILLEKLLIVTSRKKYRIKTMNDKEREDYCIYRNGYENKLEEMAKNGSITPRFGIELRE